MCGDQAAKLLAAPAEESWEGGWWQIMGSLFCFVFFCLWGGGGGGWDLGFKV